MKWPWQKRNINDPTKGLTPAIVWGEGAKVFAPGGSSAMQISAVLSCVRVLSESVASLSWLVYRRLQGGGKDRAPQHPAYKILHARANPAMSPFTFRERMMQDVLLHGNAYALVTYSNGSPVSLWPLNPYQVEPMISETRDAVRYRVTLPGGQSDIYRDGEIIHISFLGDGIKGKSVIQYNAGAFGLAIAEDDYAQAFFANGAYAGGVLESEKPLSKEARERLREGWQKAYGRHEGGVNWHRVAVLEEGLKWRAMTVNPKDAMALESRQYQVAEIARMFRVPPHLVGDLSRATFSNIEHQSLEFVMHTLRPWVVRIEQEVNYKLFGQDPDHFSEMLLDSMLRGDIESRNKAYSIMRQNGVLNANEWRERENLNPLPDGAGEKYIVQLNMQELSQLGSQE
jgi:HK97 family phage portal protein